MTRPKGSDLVFLISDPQNRDARWIALEQSRARSHAARVSHPSTRTLHLTTKAKAWQQSRRLDHKNRHDHDTPCPERILRIVPVDTLYWLPHHKDETTYQTFDYFAKVVAPSLQPLYEILEITNPFTSFVFRFITESESFCHASIARLLSSIDEGQNHVTDATGRLMTFHQTKAIRLLRQEVGKATLPTNAMLATILYLIVNELEDGQSESADMHRKHLTRLVKIRGGLDTLGPDGFERAMLMQYDDIFSLERGPSRLISRKAYSPKYPPFPFSAEFLSLMDAFPSGFRSLALYGILPLEIINLVCRATVAFQRSGGKSIYVPFSAPDSLCHSERRKYDCFSEACPWLLAPDEQVHPLLKPLTLALILWCCNAFIKVRHYTCIYAGCLRALTTRLLRSTSTTTNMPRDGTMAVDERNCLIWIWIVTIDSWRFDTANKLLPTGKELLVYFESYFPYEFAHPDVLDGVLARFLLTDELRCAVKTLWNEI